MGGIGGVMKILNYAFSPKVVLRAFSTHHPIKEILKQLHKKRLGYGSLETISMEGKKIQVLTLQDGQKFYWFKGEEKPELLAEELLEELLETVTWK